MCVLADVLKLLVYSSQGCGSILLLKNVHFQNFGHTFDLGPKIRNFEEIMFNSILFNSFT